MHRWLCILIAMGLCGFSMAGKRLSMRKGDVNTAFISFENTPTPHDMDGYGEEHENILSLGAGHIWIQDQYLSPLLYSGHYVKLSNEWWQNFPKHPQQLEYTKHNYYNQRFLKGSMLRKTWKHVGKFHLDFGWLYNDIYSNLVYSFGINGGWGTCYTWKWRKPSIEVLIGPYLEVDFTNKLQSVQVNKPYSMDLAANLCGMGGLSWAFDTRGTSFRLRYIAQINVVGAEYVPNYWQSYYEMTEGVLGDIKLSGVWNHWHLKHELTFDMQFKHSTWRLGFTHAYLEYGTENMRFSNEKMGIVVGCIWNYRTTTSKSLSKW